MRISRSKSTVFALGALLCVTGRVAANDSTATLGTGGLELTVSPDIVMKSEDLYLSPRDVRVNYVFRNESNQDIRTRVAFPLPEVPFGPIDNVDLPKADEANFVDFSVKVDGQAVKPELEVRAISSPVDDDADAKPAYPQGEDITDAVRRAGLVVNANLAAWKRTLQDLPTDKRTKLVKEGLLYDDGGDGSVDGLSPQWSMRETYHWEQTFPAGRPLKVEHHYRPVVGSSLFTGDPSDMETIGSEFAEPYCLDHAGMAGVRRLLDKAKAANAHGKDDTYLFAVETEYVLKTGANWKSDIGDFRLTIDKLHPDAVMSTCVDGIKKTGATTFTVERTGFNPKHDVRFVVFRIGDPG